MKLPAKPAADYFTTNRARVMERLQGGLLVAAGYTGMQRTNDEEVAFVQESNFWWLSGVEFADWWLIIDARRGKTWLVEPEIDERQRLFAESLLADEAMATSGIGEVLSRDQAMTMLRSAAKSHKLVYTVGQSPYAEHFDFTLNPAAKNLRDTLDRIFSSVREFRPELATLRAIKQPCELKWMQAAIDLTAETLSSIKGNLGSYAHEYEIEAELSYAFRRTGASGHAFDPIVASGTHAATIHYFSNNSPIRRSSLVMMDVGARVNGFAADVTRTYAHGTPTKRMREIHSAVQAAQSEIIALLRPGLSLVEYQAQVDGIVKRHMVAAKLITSPDDEDGYRRHMAHAVSHGLGIDVHESLGQPKVFEPGMVLTVEPGMYTAAEGIGVRIEDDILITDTGARNLSQKLTTDL